MKRLDNHEVYLQDYYCHRIDTCVMKERKKNIYLPSTKYLIHNVGTYKKQILIQKG